VCHDVYSPDAMIASSSSSFVHGRTRHNISHARSINVPKARISSNGSYISYICLMHHMCFLANLAKLLLHMWDPSPRMVRLTFGCQKCM
jgi:hypothetical protein